MRAVARRIERHRQRMHALPQVALGHYPTQLDPLPRLSKELGVTLLVKREDASGLAFGGNKVRQHEYVLGAAMAAGADCLVHAAAAQSNQSRQLSAAGARVGLDVFLLPRTGPGDGPPQGNLLLDHLLGAWVTPLPLERRSIQAKEELATRLREQGRHPFVVGMGSTQSLELAALAFIEALFEIALALPEWREVDWIYTASQGSTQAGLVAGCHLLGWRTRVVGINPTPPGHEAYLSPERILELARRACGLADCEPEDLKLDAITNVTDFVGEDYGVPSPEAMAAMRLAATREGLLLDPVYTGKAFAGLLAHVAEGRVRSGETVVFVHTGGLPVLFATDWTELGVPWAASAHPQR